ncbi:MAG: glycosyltransferase family 2 protein [Candidatus Bathyarchaeota archaeon]|nr:glycosyltransferase family 2 protein [Candidatus Bathyarchaeota archaeon]
MNECARRQREHLVRQPSLADDRVKVSVIVPAYNEEENIPKILRMLMDVEQVLPSMEIIVIDDGSTDGTLEEVAKFSSSVKLLKHEKNFGKGAALATGFDEANGEVVVVQDADLEYSPYDIPKLVKPILGGEADVVFGSRFKGARNGMKFMNYVGNKILSSTTALLYGIPITDVMTGHKIFAKRVIKSMDLTEDGFKIEPEIAAEVFYGGWRYTEVPITYTRRKSGKSKFRFYKDGLNCLLRLIRARIYRRTLYTPRNTKKA